MSWSRRNRLVDKAAFKFAAIFVLCFFTSHARASSNQGLFAAEASYHTGPLTNSHVGQFSYGALFQAETGGPLRYIFGLSARRGAFDMDIAGTNYSVISLDLQIRMGIVIDFFPNSATHPFLAATGLGGTNLLTSSNPPTGASQSQASYGWGYEFEAGINIKRRRGGAFRISGAYRKYKFSYGGESIASDAIAGRLGIVF